MNEIWASSEIASGDGFAARTEAVHHPDAAVSRAETDGRHDLRLEETEQDVRDGFAHGTIPDSKIQTALTGTSGP